MKILFINVVCGIYSTGKICAELAQEAEAQGHTAKIAYGRDTVPPQYEKYAVRIGSDLGNKLHALHTRVTDRHCFASTLATKKFLAWADEYDPDVLWLHNFHGYFVNIELLFNWIKTRPNMQVKWTLHDCWPFTGHCAHFSFVGCDKWKTGCHHCPQGSSYPATAVLDSSHWNYKKKKALFTGIPNMTLITPSKWLADLVKESFLAEYPVEVQYNTVNTDVFKPTPGDFRQRNGLEDKKLLLGVASTWTDKKGLPDFAQLAGMLDDSYRIVLVGLNTEQARQMPANVIALPRTKNAQELAELYTTADLLVTASREETFGLTILEAHHCGTKSVVYQGTACEEVAELYGGVAVEMGAENLYRAVTQLFEQKK